MQGFSPPRDGGLKSEAKCANSLFLPNLNLPPRSRAEGGGDDVTLIGVVDCGAQPVCPSFAAVRKASGEASHDHDSEAFMHIRIHVCMIM